MALRLGNNIAVIDDETVFENFCKVLLVYKSIAACVPSVHECTSAVKVKNSKMTRMGFEPMNLSILEPYSSALTARPSRLIMTYYLISHYNLYSRQIVWQNSTSYYATAEKKKKPPHFQHYGRLSPEDVRICQVILIFSKRK